ncbi:hypothetical protein LAD12857_03910 [Lacrimispora amygdalina]|uniref:Uncharacterized protein n=1 Tax=Lacrimispora amygdalina TaxID=253257 RepID=A0ABQ5M0J4_9FIRM
MLKHWASHAEYQLFVSEAVSLLNESQLKKLSYILTFLFAFFNVDYRLRYLFTKHAYSFPDL